ncbi:hypothetical protein Scep_030246 [Stephania cephalantha]|uniref:Uncharacterized protein n=1 Tax=Stephania cephalantha TaxID=152367 RepID=A0AAP0HIG1_9MAGN
MQQNGELVERMSVFLKTIRACALGQSTNIIYLSEMNGKLVVVCEIEQTPELREKIFKEFMG